MDAQRWGTSVSRSGEIRVSVVTSADSTPAPREVAADWMEALHQALATTEHTPPCWPTSTPARQGPFPCGSSANTGMVQHHHLAASECDLVNTDGRTATRTNRSRACTRPMASRTRWRDGRPDSRHRDAVHPRGDLAQDPPGLGGLPLSAAGTRGRGDGAQRRTRHSRTAASPVSTDSTGPAGHHPAGRRWLARGRCRGEAGDLINRVLDSEIELPDP